MRVLGGQGQCKLVEVQFNDCSNVHQYSEHKITDLKNRLKKSQNIRLTQLEIFCYR